MESKVCRRCGVDKPLDAYSPDPRGRQGRFAVCKACRNSQQRGDREAQGDGYRKYIREYRRDWKRGIKRQRVAPVSDGPTYRKPNQMAKAHAAVNNAIAGGQLVKGTECSQCGAVEKLHAHHQDYTRPLDVLWLCARCHTDLHYWTRWPLKRTG